MAHEAHESQKPNSAMLYSKSMNTVKKKMQTIVKVVGRDTPGSTI
jgi:hypothetical protein